LNACTRRDQRLRPDRRGVFAPRRQSGADIEWVAVNDLTDAATMAHLLRYDSLFGRYPGTVEVDGDTLRSTAGDQGARRARPGGAPWGELGVDVVIESTGLFTDARRRQAPRAAARARS
jgi:glyceraldehyde 3-phosphate dehydrogenase